MDITNQPPWFVDLFLDCYELLTSNRAEMFLKARTAFLRKEKEPKVYAGCMLTEDLTQFIVIGNTTLTSETQTIKFIYHLNEQEKENLLKRRSDNRD
jgi:hypothetical protein